MEHIDNWLNRDQSEDQYQITCSICNQLFLTTSPTSCYECELCRIVKKAKEHDRGRY